MKKYYDRISLALSLASLVVLSPIFAVSAAEVNPLEKLKLGNQRYVTSTTVCHEDWTAKRSSMVKDQLPFAIIVSCQIRESLQKSSSIKP